MYVAFRDALTGLEYLHRSSDLATKGLHFELGAYKSNVYLDWRDLRDEGTRPWGALCDMLAGRGVSSLDDALRDLELKPVHEAARALLDPETIKTLAPSKTKPKKPPVEVLVERAKALLDASCHYAATPAAEVAGFGSQRKWTGTSENALAQFRERIESAQKLDTVLKQFSAPWRKEAEIVLPVAGSTPLMATVIAWAALEAIGLNCSPDDPDAAAAQLFDAMRLREVMAQSFAKAGMSEEDKWRAAARVRAAFAHASWLPLAKLSKTHSAGPFTWIHDPDVAWLIGVHEWKGDRFFNKEAFQQLLWWMALRPLLDLAATDKPDPAQVTALEKELASRIKAAEDSGYRVEALLNATKIAAPAPPTESPKPVPIVESTPIADDKQLAESRPKQAAAKKSVDSKTEEKQATVKKKTAAKKKPTKK
jgi:hypothetical protein